MILHHVMIVGLTSDHGQMWAKCGHGWRCPMSPRRVRPPRSIPSEHSRSTRAPPTHSEQFAQANLAPGPAIAASTGGRTSTFRHVAAAGQKTNRTRAEAERYRQEVHLIGLCTRNMICCYFSKMKRLAYEFSVAIAAGLVTWLFAERMDATRGLAAWSLGAGAFVVSFGLIFLLLPRADADRSTFRFLDRVRTKGNVRVRGVQVRTGADSARVMTRMRARNDIDISDSTVEHRHQGTTGDE